MYCLTGARKIVGRAFAAFLLGAMLAAPAQAQDEVGADGKLKVCADPYMLPFSNQEEKGYENRIAELFAEKLGWELSYEWFPQRMGFIRNTLRARGPDGDYKCDLVISVPEHFELAATTDPYYTSTYVLVIAKGRGLDDVTSPEMLGKVVQEEGRQVRIGLSDQAPPAELWVFRNGLMGNMVPYIGQPGDPKVNPGEVVMRDIKAGKIDAAVVWGPTAGYYARELGGEKAFTLMNLHDNPEYPDMRFEFSIAMGVRHGDDEWLQRVNRLIHENEAEINAILEEYGVPLLPLKKTPKKDDDDD
jgi:quinoprotein dehydrogenase-associated probable ABC transporter substrate-binding protein